MFQRIAQYSSLTAEGRIYRPRAYGDPRPDGVWDGWLVFFPIDGGTAIASDRETTQPSLSALTAWAAKLGDVYLAGALNRALRIAEQPPILTSLARAEYDALTDAEQLEMTARAIERERVATEQALAAAEESAASAEAAAHEHVAKTARAVAADARERRRGTSKKKGAK